MAEPSRCSGCGRCHRLLVTPMITRTLSRLLVGSLLPQCPAIKWRKPRNPLNQVMNSSKKKPAPCRMMKSKTRVILRLSKHELFNQKPASGKSCASCHGEKGEKLDVKKPARYPIYDKALVVWCVWMIALIFVVKNNW